MAYETERMLSGFHGAVETAVGLGMLGLLTAGRDVAADRAAHQVRLGAARAQGTAEGLHEVIASLRDQLACAQADVRGLRRDVAALELDNSILRELAAENA